MYTKKQFGYELKQKLYLKCDVVEIGKWAYLVYWKNQYELDPEFERFLIDLGTMEMGPEFELSYEKLHEIADRLIAGQDVTI